MAELKMVFGFSDEFLEFAVQCSSQYDDTTRNMARELLENRKRIAELERLKHNSYPHMCRDEHVQIGHADNSSELCPLCRVINERDALRAEVKRLTGAGDEG